MLTNLEIGSALKVLTKLYYYKHDELRREAIKKKESWYFQQLKREINLLKNTINLLDNRKNKKEI